MSRKTICYYVSGHGLGHASRASQVMAEIPKNVRLIVKSLAPEWFFHLRACRPLLYIPHQFDLGVWQVSNVELDWERTIREASAIEDRNEKYRNNELHFLRGEGVDVVVCDVAPFPLSVAQEAGIPGVAIVNFTWVDIYKGPARKLGFGGELVQSYRENYRSAAACLRTPMSLRMPYLPNITDIPLIARRGESRRRELIKELDCAGCKIVLVYTGTWKDEVDFGQLGRFYGIEFIALNKMPAPVRVLDTSKWDFADLVASVDAVVAKPGYGTMGECMANGTPVVFYPRPEFAEYRGLRATIMDWGGAVQMSKSQFMSCRWDTALEEAFSLKPRRVDCSGGKVAARKILEL